MRITDEELLARARLALAILQSPVRAEGGQYQGPWVRALAASMLLALPSDTLLQEGEYDLGLALDFDLRAGFEPTVTLEGAGFLSPEYQGSTTVGPGNIPAWRMVVPPPADVIETLISVKNVETAITQVMADFDARRSVFIHPGHAAQTSSDEGVDSQEKTATLVPSEGGVGGGVSDKIPCHSETDSPEREVEILSIPTNSTGTREAPVSQTVSQTLSTQKDPPSSPSGLPLPEKELSPLERLRKMRGLKEQGADPLEAAAQAREQELKGIRTQHARRNNIDDAVVRAIYDFVPESFHIVRQLLRDTAMPPEKLLKYLREKPALVRALREMDRTRYREALLYGRDNAARHTKGWQQYSYVWLMDWLIKDYGQRHELGEKKQPARPMATAMNALRVEVRAAADYDEAIAIIDRYIERGEYDNKRTREAYARIYHTP